MHLLFRVRCKPNDTKRPVEVADVLQFVDVAQEQGRTDRAMMVTTSEVSVHVRGIEEKWSHYLSLHDHEDVRAWVQTYGSWTQTAEGELWIPKGMGSQLSWFKQKHVLLLGDFSPAGKARLETIGLILRQRGYQVFTLDEVNESPDYDLRQKLTAAATVCRFVVVDDSSRAGQLAEIPELDHLRVISVVLRNRTCVSTFVLRPLEATSKVMKEIEYNPEDLQTATDHGIAWAEDRVEQLRVERARVLPWRGER